MVALSAVRADHRTKMAAASDVQTDVELIEIEKRMLMAMSKPLCLVPDVNVFFIASAAQFNRRKFELRPKVGFS